MYNVFMSNTANNPIINSYLVMSLLVAVLLILSACAAQNTVTTANSDSTATPAFTSTPAPTNVPTPTPDTRLEADFSEPRIIGSRRAIFCAGIDTSDTMEDVGFSVVNLNGVIIAESTAQLYEGNYYLQVNNLESDTEYALKMYYVLAGTKDYTKNETTFKTPAKVLSDEDVESILKQALQGKVFEIGTIKYNRSTTQRALKLLDISTGDPGIKSYTLQLNQIKLEYSFNSYNKYTDWDKVDGECDEETTEVLKDIISVNESIEYDDFFCAFVPSPHTLSAYNKHDEEGGQFDAEQYLYDNLLIDENAYLMYLEYPFIYESPEFQEKYALQIAENEGNAQLSKYLNHRVAENKFFFSYYSKDFMDIYAVPQDRYIELYYAGGMTIQTAAAFSYLVTEIPPGYPPLKISTSYRDYALQAYFYTRGNVMKSALDYGDYWHLFRQQQSYVPGFSNHQYGIALDFQDIATFADSSLYPYLQENAQRYGFYNYYVEAWHWVYLGE